MIYRKDLQIMTLIYLTALLFFSRCNNPEVVFPDTQNSTVRLTGFVAPAGVAGKAFLFENIAIDSAAIDPATGCFTFDNIVRGAYQLRIVVPGYGTYKENIFLNSYRNTAGTITLSRLPSPVNRVTPPDSSLIIFRSCSPAEPEAAGRKQYRSTSDTIVELRFNFKAPMDTASTTAALSVEPHMEYEVVYSNESSEGNCVILFSAKDFFRHSELTVTLGREAKTIYGEHLDFDLRQYYFIASSCLSKAVFSEFIQQSTPVDGHPMVAPDDDVYLVFRHLMNETSVEQALSVVPQEPMNLFWTATPQGQHLLRIVFPSSLAPATRYVLRIDSTAYTGDSAAPAVPVALSFTTVFFRVNNYTPLRGTVNVPVDTPFSYEFDLPVDSASFYEAFSIMPAVDSLWIVMLDSSKKVVVHHSWLLSRQSYTVAIDTGLVNLKGTHLRTGFGQSFVTGVYPSILRSVTPADTFVPVATGDTIIVEFSGSMVPASFTDRLRFTPDIPYITRWTTPQASRLEIIALQTLRSNTIYTLTIDSGYTTAYGITGNSIVSRFKTERLRVIALSPWHNRINVPDNSPCKFTFNTPVDTASFLSNITADPEVDSLVIIPADDGTTVAVSLGHSPFKEATRYTITLGDGITDIYGAPMEQEFTFSFTTE